MYQLTEDVVIQKVSNGATAGTTEVDSSIVDMSGWDGCCFIVDLATVVDASVLTLNVQENSANSTSGMATITGATATFTASTSSNKTLIVDVIKPSKRYVRAQFTRTAQNATVNTILCVLYRARSRPTSADASALAQTTVVGS